MDPVECVKFISKKNVKTDNVTVPWAWKSYEENLEWLIQWNRQVHSKVNINIEKPQIIKYLNKVTSWRKEKSLL